MWEILITVVAIIALAMLLSHLLLEPPATGLPATEGIGRGTARDRASAENETAVAMLRDVQTTIDKVPLHKRLGAARTLIDQGIFGGSIDPVELGVSITEVDINGVPAEWVCAPDADPNARLLYVHGGAFALGSRKSHRALAANFSKRAGISVLTFDYRLMPENPRLACNEDSQKAYRWIIDNGPNGTGNVETLFVAGDSAGGSLALMLLAWARDQRLRPADRAVALSPTTDASGSSASMRENASTDVMLGPSIGKLMKLPAPLLRIVILLAGRTRPDNPAVSPVFGNLNGLPPTLIHASECEMLLDDSIRWVSKARAAGTDARLETWPGMLHVWHLFDHILPEANEALDRIAVFLHEGFSAET